MGHVPRSTRPFHGVRSCRQYVGIGITLFLDSLGRKPGILLGSAITAVASLLMFLSPSFSLLLLFRGMQTAGIAISLNSNITWFNEQTPRTGRGLLYSLSLVGWPFGKQVLISVAALTPPGRWKASRSSVAC